MANRPLVLIAFAFLDGALIFKQFQFLAQIKAHSHQPAQHCQRKQERWPMKQENKEIRHKYTG